jgi:hypothetical protein
VLSRLFICLLLLLFLATAALSYGESSQAIYAISRFTLSSASGPLMQGGNYRLVSMAGEPVTGQMSGGDFVASSGFGQEAPAPQQQFVYLPVVLRQ